MKKSILFLLSVPLYLNGMHLSTPDEVYQQLVDQYTQSSLEKIPHDPMVIEKLLLNAITRGDETLVTQIIAQLPTVLQRAPSGYASWYQFATHCASECSIKHPELLQKMGTIANFIMIKQVAQKPSATPPQLPKIQTPQLHKVRSVTTRETIPQLPMLSTASFRAESSATGADKQSKETSAKKVLKSSLPKHTIQTPTTPFWVAAAVVAVAACCCAILYKLYNYGNATHNDPHDDHQEGGQEELA